MQPPTGPRSRSWQPESALTLPDNPKLNWGSSAHWSVDEWVTAISEINYPTTREAAVRAKRPTVCDIGLSCKRKSAQRRADIAVNTVHLPFNIVHLPFNLTTSQAGIALVTFHSAG